MLKSIKLVFYIAFVALLISACARPCPKDIKAGEVKFSSNTLELIEYMQDLTNLKFENQNGEIQQFQLRFTDIHGTTKIPLEVLCQRGDFLDATSQIRYLEAPTFYMTFATPDLMTEINFQASIVNDAGSLEGDTVLYETFNIWIQDVPLSASGGFSYLSNDRGNAADFSEIPFNLQAGYSFVSDTIVEGHHLKNVYFNKDLSSGIRLFYAKDEGVVCFQTMIDTWILKMD